MFRSQLIPYLTAMFSSGNLTSADYQKLISGLGSESDRPHIVCSSSTNNIPDDLLLSSEYEMPVVRPATGSGSCSSCCCPPAPTPPAPPVPDTHMEKVINILCDWFREGWLLDCVGVSTVTSSAKAYYWVVSSDSASGVFDILSVQFGNPGFDTETISSAKCVRVLRLVYNREQQSVVSTDSWLLLTGLGGGGSSIEVVQVPGSSTTAVMSQAAVTRELATLSSPTIVTVDGPTPTIAVEGYRIYNCGVLSSLTFSSIESSPKLSVVYFTTSSNGTTIDWGSLIPVAGWQDLSANRQYAIEFLNGRAVIYYFN